MIPRSLASGDRGGDRTQVAWIWLLSATLVALSFFLQSHVGINLQDEGYLWYGAWRVGEGEVPRLDFRAYDPPRNYWLAAGSTLFGDGPRGMRATAALFQGLGLSLGLLAARRVIRTRWMLVPVAALLLVWMFPRHKVFEHAIAMAAVYVGVRLLERPNTTTSFWSGVFVGIAGSFRRNHALYAFLGFTGILTYCCQKPLSGRNLVRMFTPFSAGVVVGFFPIWILTILYSGFGSAYLDSILVILRRGQTNQPLPIPWPWLVDFGGLGWLDAGHRVAVGVGFVCFLVFFPLAILRLWATRGQPSPQRNLLLASTLVGLPYAHHALVRSDLSHLCQAAHPELLGTVALVALSSHGWRRVTAALVSPLLVAVTLLGPLLRQPGVVKTRRPHLFVSRELAGDRLWIHRLDAQLIDATRLLLEERALPSDSVLFAPTLPGMYRIVERRSPIWDSYPIWPVSRNHQLRMVADLEAAEVKWAVVSRRPVGGVNFWDTHPIVWGYLERSFDEVEVEAFPDSYTVLRRRQGAVDRTP